MKRTRPLPPGGLEQALYDGKRRRRHAVLGGGGATAALVAAVLVAVSLQGPAERSSLEITTSPEPSVSAPTKTSSPPDVTVRRTPDAVGPSPRASVDCINNNCEDVDPLPASSFVAGPSRPSYTEQPEDYLDIRQTCISGSRNPERVCLDSANGYDATVRRGKTLKIESHICLAANSQGPVELHFPTGGEHDVVVKRDAKPTYHWRFASTVSFTGAEHTITLLPKRCRRWYTDWAAVDSRGRALPTGDYDATVVYLADKRNGSPRDPYDFYEVGFTLHVSVTA